MILVILLQTGKGAGIGAAFGGGSQTVFGPRGAGSFIGKLTGTVAGLFMLTSIALAFQSTSRSTGVEERARALTNEKAKAVESVDLGEKEAPKAPEEKAKPALAPDGGPAVDQPAASETEAKDADHKTGDSAAKEPAGDETSAPSGIGEKADTPPGLEEKAAEKPVKPAARAKPKKVAAKPEKSEKIVSPEPAEPEAPESAPPPAKAPSPVE